jgi:adenine-specific DNA-methyltransferase
MSTNISKQKREKLVEKINAIRDYIARCDQDTNTSQLLQYISEIEKDINGKKYGLVFEEHREEIDEKLATHTPVLTEDGSLFIDNGGQMNFLIEGDNLASLKLLEKTHKGKIDAIYVDPPYNTGAKNWRYNNNYVDNTDMFRHSKWLSFMKARLVIAKNLLKETGIIVLTIDDYEIENITLLMNEIFGEENHLGTVVIKNNPQGRSSVTGFQISHEYGLFYGGTKARIGRLARNEEQLARYKEKDEYGPFEWRNFRAQYSSESPKMVYPIFVKKDLSDFRIPQMEWDENNKKYNLCEQPLDDEVISLPIDETGRQRTWKWSIETALREKNKNLGVRTDRLGNPTVYYKGRMKSLKMQPYTFWDKPEYSASTFGANILADIIGKKKFDYPKSIFAVMDSIQVASESTSATVLDFFAGSGTTGHAVMKLNAEDGGNRRFILCTNNENNICRDVTYERIKRVIDKEGYAASLKYFKVDYIPVSERMYYEYADELLAHIRELVELENGINFTGNAEVGIVLTEDELAEFIANGEAFAKCRKLYMGHDLLPDEEQEKILRSRGIEISIIPDYYYRDLQEG